MLGDGRLVAAESGDIVFANAQAAALFRLSEADLVGLRTALGQAWMAVVAAELSGVSGLGSRMMQASSLLATDIVVVYMLTMAALYGLMDAFFMAAQGRLLKWKP